MAKFIDYQLKDNNFGVIRNIYKNQKYDSLSGEEAKKLVERLKQSEERSNDKIFAKKKNSYIESIKKISKEITSLR